MAKSLTQRVRDFVRQVRDADGEEEAERIARENLSRLDPEAREDETRGNVRDETGSHTHIYLPGGGPAGAVRTGRDDVEIPENGGGATGGADPTLADLAQRVAALEELIEQLLGNNEEDVELEDPATQDARRFKLRRGKAMRSRDEDDVPVRRPDMIGATDLPGLEDLDERMARGTTSGANVTGDRRRTGDRRMLDSADMEDKWDELVANAEVITPGFRVGTFDARLTPDRTAERMCAGRRRCLGEGFAKEEIARLISDTTGLKTRDAVMDKRLSCDSVKMAFTAVAAAIRDRNNGAATRRTADVDAAARANGSGQRPKVPTLAEMNAQSKEFWKARDGNGAVRR
jgi:hypothetical protein